MEPGLSSVSKKLNATVRPSGEEDVMGQGLKVKAKTGFRPETT